MKKNYSSDLVSVIVPTYNRAHLIVPTLDSIFRQTYRPIEVIVVDDGSCDGTADVVQDWAGDKGAVDTAFSVRYLRQDNSGPSAARNSGLCECSGEFIQFLDADDIIHQDKLAIQVSAIRQKNVDFCVCNYQPFADSLSKLGPVVDFYSRAHSIDDFPAQCPMDTPAPLYRREVVLANGPWDDNLSAGEDFEYNFRIIARGSRGVWLDEVLLYVRRHEGPERIQATPVATRYKSMYIGLAKIEIESVERGVCSRKLLHSLGIRAYHYYRLIKAEGNHHEASIFLRYTRSRLFWTTRAAFFAKRALPTPLAKVCVILKRILRGKKR